MNRPTYILTAELDNASFHWLDQLRRTHFPPDRNVLPAHLTLFHRLSEGQLELLRGLDLPSCALHLEYAGPVLLGSGVAIRVSSPALQRLRSDLRNSLGELSRQDAQGWRPHVTIQTKVTAAIARKLFDDLAGRFPVRAGSMRGLLAWQYLGGPWSLAERFAFDRRG